MPRENAIGIVRTHRNAERFLQAVRHTHSHQHSRCPKAVEMAASTEGLAAAAAVMGSWVALLGSEEAVVARACTRPTMTGRT